MDIQPIKLFTPYYKAVTNKRQDELDQCLLNNIKNSEISKIYLMIDDGYMPPFKSEKLEIVPVHGRPTYKQWIDLSYTYGGIYISVLANSDIYLDDTISKMRDILIKPKSFIGLSRYDMINGVLEAHPKPHWSQDVWGFSTLSTVTENIKKMMDIPLGVPRCDNKIAYIFSIHGWNIFNPFDFITCVHLHESRCRGYDKNKDITVIGGVAYIYPNDELDISSNIEIDIWVKKNNKIKNASINSVLEKWCENKVSQEKIMREEMADTNVYELVSQVELPASTKIMYLRNGCLIYNYLKRFYIFRLNDEYLCMDFMTLSITTKFKSHEIIYGLINNIPLRILATFIPPVINVAPINIQERPTSKNDSDFWQYPCLTEKQAYINHLCIDNGGNVDFENRIIHTYLGLPWATYIDKKIYPAKVHKLIKIKISGLKMLAESNGYTLKIHTVCQQIHWRNMLQKFNDLGVTDLHLSHNEVGADSDCKKFGITVHSWTLIAVNVEDKHRSAGLVFNKSIKNKKYLASFIGAHMEHYRTDIRLKLSEVAKKEVSDDILFELEGEWHFNPVVYQEQVSNNRVTVVDNNKNMDAAYRYNQILSDSIFSLCPEGAGPNTLRLWESMAVGAIPVIFSDKWIAPSLLNYPIEKCVIFLKNDDANGLVEYLKSFNQERLNIMSKNCIFFYEKYKNIIAFRKGDE